MGGIASIFSPPKKPRRTASTIVTDEAAARRAKKEEEKKKRTAFKLAQIATSAGGILSEANTSRRKLLGN